MTQICIEIFSQGEELLIGQTVDTNSAWLSEQLVALGFTVKRHTTVGDNLSDLVQLLQEIAVRADVCICSGGLGPTSDDLTAEAVAIAFDLPLEFDAEAYAQIRAFFERRKRTMPETNRKQALFPRGAMRIDNAWGTAPGFAVQIESCWFSFVPGVPSEMRHLFEETIKPRLLEVYPVSPSQRVTLKTIGIGESAIQEQIAGIVLPDAVQLGFRTSEEDNQTKLVFPADFPENERNALVRQFEQALDDAVFALDEPGKSSGNLVTVLGEILLREHQTLSVLETLSQGLIAAKCVGQPWLIQSIYQQNWRAYCEQYKITQMDLEVSGITQQLAETERQRSGADYSLAQCYEGELAALQDKDGAVTIHTALATETATYIQTHTVAGTLRRKQNQAALMALDLLRRFLQQKLS